MRYFITLITLVAGFVCNAQYQKDDRRLTAKLDSFFAFGFKETDPGGSILIQQGDKILYSRSFGLADIQTKEKFSSQTISNTGSISKTFVAYGILLLQEQGKLSIEDPILNYFPDFKNKEIATKVKIKHLLTHTSGLPDSRKVDQDSIFYLSARDEENFAPLKQTDSLEFEPGSQRKYSNPSYNGLALIIEKVSGMKWQKFIEENIFNKTGMKNSKITDGPYPEKNVGHGYRYVNGKFEEYDYGECPTFAAAGNGGIWSSVEELKKYVDAIKTCSFLNCETLAFSQNIWYPENWDSKQPPSQGFSWFITEPKNKNGYKIIEHSGSQGGFRAHLFIIPEPDITIIWLTNNDRAVSSYLLTALRDLQYVK